ncbi:uncharacterized protein N7500_006506 [Penicillium coprophilum]|uniref:uncharacterized protein n=1 Tax=Penicillium coprophilum TaxID=36646 RepID=UPI00239BEEBD|nr:uncharacterized protein N7500_006506 [Penicillium coprophilum]KAJ5164676.1 hypothetical protein N7500_006506 [Penicillium coprophilum]
MVCYSCYSILGKTCNLDYISWTRLSIHSNLGLIYGTCECCSPSHSACLALRHLQLLATLDCLFQKLIMVYREVGPPTPPVVLLSMDLWRVTPGIVRRRCPKTKRLLNTWSLPS